MNAIKLIKEIANELKDSKLEQSKLDKSKLNELAKLLGMRTWEEALIFVPMFARACDGKTASLTDIAWFYSCTALDIMEYNFALNALVEKGFIYHSNLKEWEVSKIEYIITPALFSALQRGEDVTQVSWMVERRTLDQFDYISMIGEMTECRKKDAMSTKQLLCLLEDREKSFSHLPIFKAIKEWNLSIEERLLFYVLAHDMIENSYSCNSDVDDTLSDIYDAPTERMNVKRTLNDGSHTLIQKEIAEMLFDNEEIRLSDLGIKSVLGENSSLYIKPTINLDRFEFVDAIGKLVESDYKASKRFKSFEIKMKVKKLERDNFQLSFIGKLNAMEDVNTHDRLLFYLIAQQFKDDSMLSLSSTSLRNSYDNRDLMQLKGELKAEKNVLQKLKLIELTPATLFEDVGLTLSEGGKELYLEEDIKLFQEQVKDKDLITPKDIKTKELFFGLELERQIELVRKSLEENNYQNLTKRLAAQSMPQGIAVLLYGLPGTGKTESVLQIAKATGRSVLHVDISATKSCWFGESEKLIKGVFVNYRKLCQKSKIKPILLFNEADAVFGKRKDTNSSSVDQTENAIQNIILEEMENLEGILIATTNLADNLDGAFERRFLFKIRFDQPSVEARAKIWASKLSTLSENEVKRLASQYDFSGGEIDNIARKAIMQEVVTGDTPTFVSLNQLCEHEKFSKPRSKPIGFR